MTTMHTTTTHTPVTVRDPWLTLFATGLLTVAVGLLMLLWPGPSLLVASVIFGIYLLASGVAAIVFGFSIHASSGHRVLMFIAGALSLILGVLAFRHFGQGYAVLLLAIWIGIGFIFNGVATTAAALGHPALPGRAWNIFFGLISVLAGIVLIAWPLGSLVTLAFVAGFWLIVIGISQMVSAVVIHRDLKRSGHLNI